MDGRRISNDDKLLWCYIFLMIIVLSSFIYFMIPSTILRRKLVLIGDGSWYVCVAPYKTETVNFTDDEIFSKIIQGNQLCFNKTVFQISNTTNWYILIVSYRTSNITMSYAVLRLVFDWYIKEEDNYKEYIPIESRIKRNPVKTSGIYSVICFSLDEVRKKLGEVTCCELWIEICGLQKPQEEYTMYPREIKIVDSIGLYQNKTFYIRKDEYNINYPIYVYTTETVTTKKCSTFFLYPLILFLFSCIVFEILRKNIKCGA